MTGNNEITGETRYVIRGIAPHKFQTTDGSRARARLADFTGRYPAARIVQVTAR